MRGSSLGFPQIDLLAVIESPDFIALNPLRGNVPDVPMVKVGKAYPTSVTNFRIVGLDTPVIRTAALTPTPSIRAEMTWTR